MALLCDCSPDVMHPGYEWIVVVRSSTFSLMVNVGADKRRQTPMPISQSCFYFPITQTYTHYPYSHITLVYFKSAQNDIYSALLTTTAAARVTLIDLLILYP